MEFLFGYLQQGLSVFIPFVILLGLLIFVHELGHFLVAKFYGVRVEVFSLGFGKKILQHKRGDTTYALSMIPLGGYVKMFGDDPTREYEESDKQQAFLHKPVGQRIAIVLAGPLMNFFFAILIYAAVTMIGEEKPLPMAGNIAPTTEAFAAGFRSGDEILAVAGEEINSWAKLQEIIQDNPNENLLFQIQRAGEVVEFSATPKLAENENPLSVETEVGTIEGLTFLSEAPVVGVLGADSIATRAGLKTGDRIASVNGQELSYWRDLESIVSQVAPGGRLNLKIIRAETTGEKNLEIGLTLPEAELAAPAIFAKVTQGQGGAFHSDYPEEAELLNSLSLMGLEEPELYLSMVEEGSPAALAGLKSGDRLFAINNQPLRQWDDVLANVKGFEPDKGPLELQYVRDGEIKATSLKPKMISHMTRKGTEEHRFTAGIRSASQYALPPTYIESTLNPATALVRGVERTWEITVMTVMSFVRLVTAEISHKNVGGVISIGQAASQTFELGIVYFLQMMAVISVNLFVLNLLPIPILDGGHLFFFSIEALRGAPLSLRKMEIAQQVGLVLLMSLMIFTVFNDISRLFDSW